MMKHNSSLLRYSILSILIIIAALACKREITAPVNKTGPERVQWARSYYEGMLKAKDDQILKPKALMSSDGRTGSSKPNKMKLDWDKAYSAATLDYDFVETPVQFDRRSAPVFMVSKDPHQKLAPDPQLINASFDRLIIYKNELGVTSQKVVTYAPDADYLKKHNGQIKHNRIDKLDNDFSGYLQYRDWDGSIAFILRIENGKAVKKMVPSQSLAPSAIAQRTTAVTSSSQAKTMNLKVRECDEWTIRFEWEQWCYYPDNASSPSYCDPPEVSNVQVFPNCPAGDGGGTVNNNTVDCTDPTNFDNGVCQPANMVPLDTANKVTNPCITAALALALGKDVKSKIKGLMTNTFLANSTVNLTFYSLPVPATSPNGAADAYSRKAGNDPLEQLIVFNDTKLKNKSQEFKVATVYHEVLHAYLSILFTKDTNGILVIPNQHENMIYNYLTMMATDLRSVFPTMTESDANALAWGGLEGTSRYSLISETQRQAIGDVNTKYSTKPGPGVTNSAGTYCN
jgi:hypothetical protein